MDFNFRFLGNIAVDGFRSKLDTLDWHYFTHRQQAHKVHRETLTVPLLFDQGFSKIGFFKDFGPFMKELEPLKKVLSDTLGNGVFQSALLVNLPAGKEVLRHVDQGEGFKAFSRIHVPLRTNENCFFEVDGEVIQMKAGEVWEINNSEKAHAVQNLGDTDRIHLLIDWKVNKG
ncbi:aspartyl/asparaginyl beta-hydroxylase domain-containing protein [Lunatimonas salinarum]|uniref:aspartyl/asparaginyl beta-hydroxylase domain-containing protein n=1 Tax=Lunatimonas salinarum TaxID=1774590 RepID=UPI001AE04477|nr:aspartyl/asparaginyl beta-hydroxylase domain-containing protein [Lunatimonas salinarum]